jgi:hypothetical protein
MASVVSITDEQNVDVGVNGPGDITSMFVVTGIANTNFAGAYDFGTGGSASASRTFEALVGPSLTPVQFRRAIATASLAGIHGFGPDDNLRSWNLLGVDADFDDDEGRVQLQFDLSVSVGVTAVAGFAGVSVYGVGFQVVILAAI